MLDFAFSAAQVHCHNESTHCCVSGTNTQQTLTGTLPAKTIQTFYGALLCQHVMVMFTLVVMSLLELFQTVVVRDSQTQADGQKKGKQKEPNTVEQGQTASMSRVFAWTIYSIHSRKTETENWQWQKTEMQELYIASTENRNCKERPSLQEFDPTERSLNWAWKPCLTTFTSNIT